MSDWLMRVIKAEAKRLIELAAEDDELRADLRALAEAILAATESDQSSTDFTSSPLPSPPTPTATAAQGARSDPAPPEAARTDAPQAAEPLRELTLGRSKPPEGNPPSVSTASSRSTTGHDDLIAIETRCRRKSEAARWAAERLRRLREGNGFPVENPPMDQETRRMGRSTHGLLLLDAVASEVSEQADLSVLDNVGGCFETVAAALAFVRGKLEEHPGNQKVLERSLPFVAEAQSALRAAFQRLGACRRPGSVRGLRVVEGDRRPAPCLHQAIHAGRRPRGSDALVDLLLARIESLGASGQLSRQQTPRSNRSGIA